MCFDNDNDDYWLRSILFINFTKIIKNMGLLLTFYFIFMIKKYWTKGFLGFHSFGE
jgi:hypothetical protein